MNEWNVNALMEVGFLPAAVVSFFALFFLFPIVLGLLKNFGFYAIVEERFAHVYVLFGKVELVLTEPGFHLLWTKMGVKALIINWLGRRYIVDQRLDQQYQRSLAVNSEEGAPMGIGVWYEMVVTDPVNYIFKNENPKGSLLANVSNSTVRSLSNMPLEKMLTDRHAMSAVVREEVTHDSTEWGFQVGSVYIRKVHFRDAEMIHQIESKVVNRLRQVTSAIKQAGANQVNIITSFAEKTAAVEFAKAAAMRPRIVGEALREITKDKEVSDCLFEVLEIQNMLDSKGSITLVPKNNPLLSSLLAGQNAPAATKDS
jgi:regulator of protease activity HflC (stomatin/prohibitin superfamily)